jgi:ESCRT-I complex subunit TSG101
MAEAAEASRQSEQQASKELERTVMIKSQLDDKIRRYLLQQISELQTLQQADSTQEKQLEWASEQKIIRQLEYFTGAKTELEQHLAATELSIQEIQDWLQHAEANSQQETQESSIQVVPTSPHDAQLLDLEATNASLADALYFLDRALYQGQLDSEQHLKQVRQCAKQQFLVRAHLMKIQKQTES